MREIETDLDLDVDNLDAESQNIILQKLRKEHKQIVREILKDNEICKTTPYCDDPRFNKVKTN